jgi:hypothetical protein
VNIQKISNALGVRYSIPIDTVTDHGLIPPMIEVFYLRSGGPPEIHIQHLDAASPVLEDVPALITALTKVLEVDQEHQKGQEG